MSMITKLTYFKGSIWRKGILSEFLEFTGAEWGNFTRYASTWLCLEQCCLKEFKKFDALKSMFLSHGEKQLIDKGDSDEKSPGTRFSRLRKVYANPMSEVYLQFYANELPLFTTYNKFLQRSDPLAHKVASTTGVLMHKIGVRFLQSDISYENIDESDIDDESRWLPLDDTFVGL